MSLPLCETCKKREVKREGCKYCSSKCAAAPRRKPRPLCVYCKKRRVKKLRSSHCSHSCASADRPRELYVRIAAKAAATVAKRKAARLRARILAVARSYQIEVVTIPVARAMAEMYRQGYATSWNACSMKHRRERERWRLSA